VNKLLALKEELLVRSENKCAPAIGARQQLVAESHMALPRGHPTSACAHSINRQSEFRGKTGSMKVEKEGASPAGSLWGRLKIQNNQSGG
jgi:hypothetical protein